MLDRVGEEAQPQQAGVLILFGAHRNLSFSLTSSVSDLIGRFGIVLLGPNHTVVDRLLLLLEQILKDELTPSAAACVHQRAPLV